MTIYILRILEFYFMSFYIAIGATCQERGVRDLWVGCSRKKEGAADTMAGLIDYGMRAGGIAERKREGGRLPDRKVNKRCMYGEGNEWGQVGIHTLSTRATKKKKRKYKREKK